MYRAANSNAGDTVATTPFLFPQAFELPKFPCKNEPGYNESSRYAETGDCRMPDLIDAANACVVCWAGYIARAVDNRGLVRCAGEGSLAVEFVSSSITSNY